MKPFHKKASLALYCLALSVFTVVAFHFPFFKHLSTCLEGGFNGVVLSVSAALLLLSLDFLLYYLLVGCLRTVGKCIVAFSLFGDAVMLYFVNTYEVLVTDEMMGNVFNTQYSEASGFFSFAAVLYLLGLFVLPSVYVFARKIEYPSVKRFLAGVGISLALVAGVAFGNMPNWPWIDRNAPELGSLLSPWSWIVNSFRYHNAEKAKNRSEIPLPDASIANDSREVCVLMIGESARRDHCSHYGYPRLTNPYTPEDGVVAIPANSSATYTTAGVKAILEPYDTDDLYEILPNYLDRTGVDVTWRTTNWGEPPVHIEKYFKPHQLKERYPEADERYDGLLLEGLKDEILACDKAKQLIILHMSTSHGPNYNTKYPAEFEVFTPVCNTVEMSKSSQEELFNAYDNSIVYTDWLIHSVIGILREIPASRTSVIFISDHGESLGENNLYMHGVPMAMAPKEQIEIPLLLWTSDPGLRVKPISLAGQHNIFHTVLRLLSIDSPVLDAEKVLYEENETAVEP